MCNGFLHFRRKWTLVERQQKWLDEFNNQEDLGWQNWRLQSKMVMCAGGRFREYESTSIFCQLCPVGTISKDGLSGSVDQNNEWPLRCRSCYSPFDPSYQSQRGQSSCQRCPSNTENTPDNVYDVTGCRCKAGYYTQYIHIKLAGEVTIPRLTNINADGEGTSSGVNKGSTEDMERSELYGMPGYECTPCHSRVSGLTLKNPQAFSGIMSLPVRGKRRGSLECGRDAPILRSTAAKEEFRIPACSIKHGVCGVFPSPVCQYSSEHTCASQTRLCMSFCPGGTDFPVAKQYFYSGGIFDL
jgi:hypothetical protein